MLLSLEYPRRSPPSTGEHATLGWVTGLRHPGLLLPFGAFCVPVAPSAGWRPNLCHMSSMSSLFSPIRLGSMELANRIVCLPMYLALPERDNEVNDLVLEYYDEMARSGASIIVVENASVEPRGLTQPRTLLASDDRFIPGLTRLAARIKRRAVKAVLQIHHAGRYANRPDRIAPSGVQTFGAIPRAMDQRDIDEVRRAFGEAARRVVEAGFDMVEIHGGTGYLLPQFLSPRTNHREDEYGGDPERRMRFPLEVMATVREAVGDDYPVSYRFLADEYMPGGLTCVDTAPFAQALCKYRPSWLSVMAGCYEAFASEPYMKDDRTEGFMVPFAAKIKQAVPGTPVVAAGRIQKVETAESIVRDGLADLVGLGRVLLADPLWPRKVSGEMTEPIQACEPGCTFCNDRIRAQKPSFCARWSKQRRDEFLARTGG